MIHPSGLLLLGPTGSGKTPLGDHMSRVGFREGACVHFDFGAELRRVALAGLPPDGLSRGDVKYLQEVLENGTLLKEEKFYIAEVILKAFLKRSHSKKPAWIIMNGLPRHVAQAEAVERIVHIERVVILECNREVVLSRIQINSGGDRSCRTDDSPEKVANRFDIFHARTKPLLSFYKENMPGITIGKIRVEVDSSPQSMFSFLGT